MGEGRVKVEGCKSGSVRESGGVEGWRSVEG